MAHSMIKNIFAPTLLCLALAACGDDSAPDMAMSPDLSASTPDLALLNDLAVVTSTDGGLINADGGANCGATFSYTTRYLGNRTSNAMSGGAAGASCTTSADCAEVCCTCDGNSNQYMVALCSDHACNPDWACLCTDVASKLKADNVCP